MNAIDRKASRQLGVLAVLLIGVVCVAALLAKSGSTRTKTVVAISTNSSSIIQLTSEGPISIGSFALNSSPGAVAQATPVVIHLPPRSYFKEADGTQRRMSSAEAIAGRSFDLIDTRHRPEIDLRK